MAQEISPEDRAKIEGLMKLSEARLLILLGYSLPESDETIMGPEKAKFLAEEWLATNMERIRVAVCRAYRKWESDSAYKDDVTIIAGIADIISSLAIGVGGFTVAALICARGLSKMCEEYSPSEGND